MNKVPSQYIPGTCNLNLDEIAYRRKAGYLGAGIFFAVLILLLTFEAPRTARLALFLPAWIAAIGYLQAKHKFCVAYGAAGEQNATPGSTKADKVSNVADALKDKLRARQINIQALAYGAIAALVTLLIPAL